MNKKNIFLVLNTGYFGDVLVTSKLTRDIKKYYPESYLVFIADSPCEDAAKGLPGVDEVFVYDRKVCHNFLDYCKFVKEFPYKFKIDYTFIPNGRKLNRAFLALLLGSKRIITSQRFQKLQFNKKICKKDVRFKNCACGMANMLSVLTNKATDFQDIEFIVPDYAEQKINNLLSELNISQELIAINPQAGDDWKCWDKSEVVKFAKLAIEDGKKIVLTGVLQDGLQTIDALNAAIGENNYINLVGKTSIPELGALYKHCSAVISVDTGSMHMAFAVGTPTLGLFFRDNYKCWGPLNLDDNSFLYNAKGLDAETVYQEYLKIKRRNKEVSAT